MNAARSVRTTRALLLTVVLACFCLTVFGVFVGMGIAGLIAGLAGQVAVAVTVVVGVIFLFVKLTQQTRTAQAGPWRPAEGDAPR
ncbi:hypothetical protein FQ377_03055 [Arthrobacter echini]|uniref:Uncharacterized protein n=1 Tax=Arthrobacter echini TaxID=1529066 RepID=A0A5D0XUT9_9MICC|nr:hypothetical protein [Arthrobacter echini]TYD00439.1 hypothetical protein FQ377_03055 [Arthrobacter echini]